ncbi:hypothetical protein [Paenibacillus contaminans]|uniref:hypothetical protein n=1 Tax=Paenibacillus contaminans TaxID=450362 RepID=UPI001314D47B|nr:hypothetical protein [Paenibacillus contaminans]
MAFVQVETLKNKQEKEAQFQELSQKIDLVLEVNELLREEIKQLKDELQKGEGVS